MHPDHSENAPRGTWNDDSASERSSDPRRSVSGPYRDPMETIRARRAALDRELRDLDAMIEKRARAIGELPAAERALRRRGPWAAVMNVARWVSRGVAVTAPAILVGMGLLVWLQGFDRPVAFAPVTHAGPSILRVGRDQFVVERSVIDAIVGNRDGCVLLEPVVEKDAIVGLRLVTLPWMSELGFERGDVILAVDDRFVAAPDGARDAFDAIRIHDRFDILVRRRGEVRTLRYHLIGGSEPWAATDHAGARPIEQAEQRALDADTAGHALDDAPHFAGIVTAHDDRRHVTEVRVLAEPWRRLAPIDADESDRERELAYRARVLEGTK